MAFAGISYLAILLATVAAFIIGSAYYGALGKQWMKAARIEEAKFTPGLLVNSIICELIMAFFLAGVIGHLGDGQVTPITALSPASSSGWASSPRRSPSTTDTRVSAGT